MKEERPGLGVAKPRVWLGSTPDRLSDLPLSGPWFRHL